MFHSKPKYAKLRNNLRLCINRLKLLEKKKTELALKARKEIADYIKIAKDDRARIRVEHIIREDYLVEAMEIVEMLCDLLLARFGMIEKMTEMDPGLEEAIATIFWVTPRMSADVDELKEVSKNLMLKYGKEFAAASQSNSLDKVNHRVLIKMSVNSPPKKLIEQYMIEIAKTFDVPFTPDESALMEDEIAEAQNLLDLEFANAPSDIPKPPTGKPPGGPPPNWGGGGDGGSSVPPDLFHPMPVHPGQQYPGMPTMTNPPHYAPPGMDLMFGGPPGQPYPPAYSMSASAPPAGPPLPAQPPAAGFIPSGGPPKPPRVGNGTDARNGISPPPEYPGPSMDNFPPAPEPPPRDASSGAQPSGKPVPAPRANLHSNMSPGLPPAPGGGTDFLANLPSVPDDSVRSAGGDDIDFDDLTKRFEELKKKK